MLPLWLLWLCPALLQPPCALSLGASPLWHTPPLQLQPKTLSEEHNEGAHKGVLDGYLASCTLALAAPPRLMRPSLTTALPELTALALAASP